MADAPQPPDVTALLQQWKRGRRDVLDALVPLVYGELRRLARGQLAREPRHLTLQATDLVHEAFLKLVDQRGDWQNRVHFYAIAATCMRRILVDHARRKQAAKRPPRGGAVDIDDTVVVDTSPLETILAVDEALTMLSASEPRHARIAELKFFGGLEVDEIAEAIGKSPATVKRDWATAKESLHHLLHGVDREGR